MEYTKKFVLVPHDQISKHVPTEDTISELDREMNAILKNKGISDDEKVKLYIQVLQKRLNILDHNNGVQDSISEPASTQNAEEEKQDLIEKSDLTKKNIKRSLSAHCDVSSKHRKAVCYESSDEENISKLDDELTQPFGFYGQPSQEWTWSSVETPDAAPMPATPETPTPATPETPMPATPETPMPATPETPMPATPETPMPATPAGVSTPRAPATPTSSPQMPDGYVHLGGDMLLGVTEFLGYLRVHLRQYVVKNNQYIPTKTGITLSPYHWQVLSDSISTLNLESPNASLIIERKLILSTTDTCVVFQHVFNMVKGGLQLSSAFLKITHEQFRELCNVRETISQFIQEKLLGPLFLKAIRDVLIVISSDDIHPEDDETFIQETLKTSLDQVLKKHIRHKLDTLNIICKGCSSDNQSEHTCFETRRCYMNRCIASIDIHNVAEDFVYENSKFYPYMTDIFIENLNACEIFESCKFQLSPWITTTFLTEEFEWMKDVSDPMLIDGKQLEPSHVPSGFGFIATSGSDSEVSTRLTDIPKPMLVDEPQPGPSRAPMGFGYVATSLAPTNDHVCYVCKKTFTRKDSLKRHMKKHGDHANHACSKCAMKFYRIDKLQEHLKTHEKKKTYSCEQCDRLFSRMSELLHHKSVDHPVPSNHRVRQPRPLARNSRRNALDVFSSDFLTPSPAAKWDFLIFLQEIRLKMHDLLVEELQQKRAIKWYCVSKIRFSRETPDGDIEYCTPYFCRKVVIELDTSMIDEHIEQAFEKIKSSFDEFLENGSGWVFDSVIHMELKTATYHPLAPSSYIPLPPKLAAKKALINIKNVDQKCFVWSVLAALHPVETHAERVCHYLSFEQELRLGNVACPVQPCKVPIIEKLNNLRINVFGYEDEEVFPLYISKREDARVTNLLYISQGDNKHYCLIKNMSRLLGDLTKYNGETFYCYSCLHRFSNETLLKDHVPYCNEHTPQRIVMPEPGEDIVLEFKQFKFSQPVPYVIYADFEALIQQIQGDITKTTSHIPCGYAYLIIGPNGLPLKPITIYRGADAVDHFLKSIVAEKDILAAKLHSITPMDMTTRDLENFQKVTHCNLCKKWLGKDRVRDHDHITGKYRQALHNKCNLQLKQRKMIPCIFHNLKNYDGHLIMQGLGKLQDHEIGVIPNTMEKYISFSIRRRMENPVTLQFIDSLQFLNASLQKLVENLYKSKFSIMENCVSSPHRELLLKKGIYPYEYMTSFSKFEETELPPRSAFYSSLTNEGITEEEYEHARNVWKSFNIKKPR
ncbi:unnamed protein product [Larinioides sclopetarius]|uniref:C2H2-type domain-containing protein n=1 Tax=Larinioides sclopetarius TaxID=280406 RepID=A0AAV1Z9T1_9ARAC